MLPTPRKRATSKSSTAPRKKTAKKQGATSYTSGGVMVKSIPRGIPLGCPKEMRVKLRFHSNQILAAPAGGNAIYSTFRANGPYDPDNAIGGAQPRYYDQWSSIYNSVTTVGATCTAHFANEQYDTTLRNVFIGVAHSAGTTPLNGTAALTKADALELPYCNYKYAAGNNAVKAVIKWSPSQYFIGKTIYDEDLASLTNTTPVRDCFFHVWMAQDIVASGALPNRTVNVVIEYDLIFFDPIVPQQS